MKNDKKMWVTPQVEKFDTNSLTQDTPAGEKSKAGLEVPVTNPLNLTS